jgi:hypothetical protein
VSQEDQAPAAGVDPEAMREWMTVGQGANLAGMAEAGDAPVELLPEPGTPTRTSRTVRLPYVKDQALKALAETRSQARGSEVTVSDVIREAVDKLLDGEFDATPDPVVALRLTLAAAERAVDRLESGRTQAA